VMTPPAWKSTLLPPTRQASPSSHLSTPQKRVAGDAASDSHTAHADTHMRSLYSPPGPQHYALVLPCLEVPELRHSLALGFHQQGVLTAEQAPSFLGLASAGGRRNEATRLQSLGHPCQTQGGPKRARREKRNLEEAQMGLQESCVLSPRSTFPNAPAL
jgi:hypothetical protein